MKFFQILIFLIPFQNHPLLSANILPRLTPIKIVGFLAALYSINIFLKPDKTGNRQVPLPLPGQLFLLFSFSQLFLCTIWFSKVGPDAVKSIISFLIFFLATRMIVLTQRDLKIVFWTCLFTMAWSSIYMYKEYFTLRHVFKGFRPRGSFGDSNYYCNAAVMILPMGAALLGQVKGFFKKSLVISLCLLITGGIVVAQSRGGFLGVIIMILLYIISSKKKFKSSFIAVTGLAIGLLFMPANFWERVKKIEVKETTEIAGDDLSNKRRVELPRAGFLMWSANPIFGVGLGNYKENSIIYNPILNEINGPGVAHNTYIEMLGETGVFGFLLYLSIFFGSIRVLNKILRRHPDSPFLYNSARSLKISMYCFFISAIFLSAQYSKFYWLLVFLIFSLHRCAKNEERRVLQKGDSL